MLTREDARYRDAELTLAGHAYRGRSIGSLVTCHQFPGHDVAFDIGQATLSVTNISNVFVTHGHDDHVGGVGTHHLRRNGFALPPARYYVPADDERLVRDLVRAQARLNRSASLETVDVYPVERASEFPVGKAGLVVRPFRATHTIPCLGYGLWGKRKRLRADLVGQPADVIIAARKRGEEVNESFEVVEVAYPGDTNLLVLDRPGGDAIRQARVLLLECTFIDDEVSPRDTERAGHVHIEKFLAAARAGAFDRNEIVVLTHFSARYTTAYIREVLERRLRDEEIRTKVRLCLPEVR